MKTWFQFVLAGGVLSVSIASLTFAWNIARMYEEERAARQACEQYIQLDGRTAARDLIKLGNCMALILRQPYPVSRYD